MTLAYFRIGKMIVDDEQNGNEMRKFYLAYEKYETLSRISRKQDKAVLPSKEALRKQLE